MEELIKKFLSGSGSGDGYGSGSGDGSGDYIIMDIDEDGIIQNWNPDLSFLNEDE